MPIYEYDCPTCGRFEVMQKISDAALDTCPTCQGAGRTSSVQRIVSASAFHLKGSGWYKTDYSSKNGTAKESKPAGAAASTTTASESKSDSSSSETKAASSDSSSSSSGSGGCGGGCKCH